MKKKQIYIFGDSILKNIILDENKHYRPIKRNYYKEFEQLYPVEFYNKSKFGQTITRGYKDIQRLLSSDFKCDIAILEYGGNDCDCDWKQVSQTPNIEHITNTPLDKFEQLYIQIIEELKNHSIKPIVMLLPPIDSQKYFNWFIQNGLNPDNILLHIKSIQKIAHYQEMYSLAATKVALKTNSELIDVRTPFLMKGEYADIMCEDGIHPNEQGYEIIAQVFTKFLENI